MKRLIILPAAAAIMIMLSGCEAVSSITSRKPDFTGAYKTDAEIQYGDFKAKADLSRNDAGEWTFDFTEPKQLMGISVEIADGTFTASLGELSVTAEDNDTYRLIPDIIASAVNRLPEIPEEEITESDGILTINSEADGKKVIITSDKNGNIISLKCPFYKIAVYFGERIDSEDLSTIEETAAWVQ